MLDQKYKNVSSWTRRWQEAYIVKYMVDKISQRVKV